MPDRSEEDTVDLEDLESELDGDATSDTADATSDASDTTIEELEAELGMDDAGGATDAGGSSHDATGGEDLGLEEDPSSQYGDLLDDAPAERGGSTDRGDATADDSGGFLSGLFGGSDADESARADETADTANATSGTGSDVLDDLDVAGVDGTDATASDAATPDAASTESSSRLARLGAYFGPKAFLATAVAMVVLGGLGRTFVPLVGGALGLAAGAFLVGLASGQSRYLETAVAGALVGAVGTFLGGVSVAFAAGATTRLLAVGGVGGLVLALLGTYFGNDLRAGLVGGGDDWSEEQV